jgi:hypothetical protein
MGPQRYTSARAGGGGVAGLLHLLLRANAFLEFFQGNVGETADYPLRVMGESPHAVDEFYDQLRELEDIVGVLTEI